MREAFERAIRENPDDAAAYSAYADWLQEQGDPRGEFMAVQLALEDETGSKAERDRLRSREAELLAAHERDWLGGLAPSVLDAESYYEKTRRMDHTFRRGWLAELFCRDLTVTEARAFAKCPEARFLTRLTVKDAATEAIAGAVDRYIDGNYEPGPDIPSGTDPYDGPALYALRHSPYLDNLRVFGLGDGPTTPDGDDSGGRFGAQGGIVHELVAKMSHLEELYLSAYNVAASDLFALPLSELRVLRYDRATEYPLDVLASNPTVGNLTHLLCHPHAQRPGDPDAYIRFDQLRAVCRSPHLQNLSHLRLRLTDFGDAGVRELIESGLLARLKTLDLSYGCVTDAGAAELAAFPGIKNLDRLDLSANALTNTGIAALTATGVQVQHAGQHGEHPDLIGEDGYLEYLSNGDWE